MKAASAVQSRGRQAAELAQVGGCHRQGLTKDGARVVGALERGICLHGSHQDPAVLTTHAVSTHRQWQPGPVVQLRLAVQTPQHEL